MKASQILAWFICLIIAFIALLTASWSGLKAAGLERRFAEMKTAAERQTALMEELRDVLREIERDLPDRPAE